MLDLDYFVTTRCILTHLDHFSRAMPLYQFCSICDTHNFLSPAGLMHLKMSQVSALQWSFLVFQTQLTAYIFTMFLPLYINQPNYTIDTGHFKQTCGIAKCKERGRGNRFSDQHLELWLIQLQICREELSKITTTEREKIPKVCSFSSKKYNRVFDLNNS